MIILNKMKYFFFVNCFLLFFQPIFSQESGKLQTGEDTIKYNTLETQDSSEKFKSFMLSILDVQYDTIRVNDLTDKLIMFFIRTVVLT